MSDPNKIINLRKALKNICIGDEIENTGLFLLEKSPDGSQVLLGSADRKYRHYCETYRGISFNILFKNEIDISKNNWLYQSEGGVDD